MIVYINASLYINNLLCKFFLRNINVDRTKMLTVYTFLPDLITSQPSTSPSIAVNIG